MKEESARVRQEEVKPVFEDQEIFKRYGLGCKVVANHNKFIRSLLEKNPKNMNEVCLIEFMKNKAPGALGIKKTL